MEKMMPENGPFEAIVTACFSYMDCCFDSFVYLTHTNGTIGISFTVSAADPLQQTICKSLVQQMGKQITVLVDGCSVEVVVRGINYSLQKNSSSFSSFEIKVENTPRLMQHLMQ